MGYYYAFEAAAIIAALGYLFFVIYWTVGIAADGVPLLFGKLKAARLFGRAARIALAVVPLYLIVLLTAVVSYHRGQHS